jgi:glycosyltransferase involved in cell wall biosynthesis
MSLTGGIDLLDRHGVQGWVYDPEQPDQPVALAVRVDGQVVARTLANLYRSDLEKAGYGSGRFGFALKLEGLSPLKPHGIEIVREEDGVGLPGTPRLLPASPDLSETLQDSLVEALSHAETEESLKHWTAFLAVQVDRLLQRRADKASNKPSAAVPREFRVRWTGRGPAPQAEPAPRALVIDETVPDENRDAGSRAIISHIRSLRRLGFGVTFVPSDMRAGDAAALQAEGVEFCGNPWCASVEEVLRRQGQSFAVVYIHRGSNTRYIPLIRHYQPRARLVYSVADLHFIRLARQAEVEERPELIDASRRFRAAELGAARVSDAVLTHSSYEAEILSQELPAGRVHTVPWSVPVKPVQTPWEQRSGIAFVGSYAHPPNLDAAWWLVQDIMPIVRSHNPQIECFLAGSGMPDALREAVAPGIRPMGFVDDIHNLYERIRLTVAPLNFGAGLKGKLLDSLACGLPCACTPVAAEGTNLPESLQGMTGKDAPAIAEAILRLHDDEAFNASCSAAGIAYIQERNCDEQVDASLRAALGLRS